MTPPSLQNEVPNLMASTMPLSTCSIKSVPEFNNTFSQEQLDPMTFKSSSMNGGMFSTTSATLLSGPKNMSMPMSMSMSQSSSTLQLSSNNSSAFNYFHDSKNASASAHMSATALLQKATQMGASASNNSINSPTMMQKTFHHNNSSDSSYDPFHIPHPHHQSHIDGAFTNQVFHKGQQEMSLVFDSNTNDVGMFSTMFMGSDHNQGSVNNMEQEVGTTTTTSSSLIHGRDVEEGNPIGASRFGSDMTTVHDFLGVGGVTSRVESLNEPQKQQQQRLGLEALTPKRLQIMNHFHHHLPHGDSAMEKSIWDM